jgi:tyrosine-protein kinase Etk/Wzc
MGTKVVLVDSDLRRPMIHSIFGLEKENGLTNYIVDELPLDKVIKPTITQNLSIVTCGVLPPNPSELLGSHKMEEFINQLKKRFDIVLFDSPPVIAVTDAAVLCSKIDAAFFVISAGNTNRDAVIRAKGLLENVNAHVVGAVLNGVQLSGKFSGSYHYYYHYYSDQEEGNKSSAI